MHNGTLPMVVWLWKCRRHFWGARPACRSVVAVAATTAGAVAGRLSSAPTTATRWPQTLTRTLIKRCA